MRSLCIRRQRCTDHISQQGRNSELVYVEWGDFLTMPAHRIEQQGELETCG